VAVLFSCGGDGGLKAKGDDSHNPFLGHSQIFFFFQITFLFLKKKKNERRRGGAPSFLAYK